MLRLDAKLLYISMIFLSSCTLFSTQKRLKLNILNWYASERPASNTIIDKKGNIVKTDSEGFYKYGCLHISDIEKLMKGY